MSLIVIDRPRVREAADVLARAMLDDAAAEYLLPDPDERLTAQREMFTALIARALDEGRVYAFGDPIVGVAVWLRRPPIEGPASPGDSTTRGSAGSPLPPDAVVRAERLAGVLRELRVISRPDEHAYLDSIGVLPEHRRQGIATQLIAAGHAWADEAGLPCALDTLTDENAAFYSRRGYGIVATAAVPGSDVRVTAMRRGTG